MQTRNIFLSGKTPHHRKKTDLPEKLKLSSVDTTLISAPQKRHAASCEVDLNLGILTQTQEECSAEENCRVWQHAPQLVANRTRRE